MGKCKSNNSICSSCNNDDNNGKYNKYKTIDLMHFISIFVSFHFLSLWWSETLLCFYRTWTGWKLTHSPLFVMCGCCSCCPCFNFPRMNFVLHLNVCLSVRASVCHSLIHWLSLVASYKAPSSCDGFSHVCIFFMDEVHHHTHKVE